MDPIQNRRSQELLQKYRAGICTPEEKAIIESWYEKELSGRKDELAEPDYSEIEKDIWDNLVQQKRSSSIRLWPRVAAAASILLCLSFVGYYLLHKEHPGQVSYYKNDIAPGHNQATLTLANGQKIILTKGLTGKLAMQGTVAIKVDSGSGITYSENSYNAQGKNVSFNTLSTAVGEQSPFPLILADGSKVWLNSQSSITFPTAFTGKERIVKVTGEALFEVVHNAKQPFKVQTAKQTIEDIGTIFNVNAYTNATKTTLVQGSVKVNGMVLKPNQQTDGREIKDVNTKRYIAWEKGDFYFENDDIQTVMRELARWYNIEVVFLGNITTEGFNAEISRRKNISEVLRLLENTKGVHFKIEGRRVTVIQ